MSFKTIVKATPRGYAKGQFQAELSETGLTLTQKQKRIEVPVGAAVSYQRENRLAVSLPDAELEIAVAKPGAFQNRLARDITQFLAGQGAMPDDGSYGMPWYFYVVCAAPLSIPIITLGGAIPAAIGFGLAALSYGLVQKNEWPIPMRIAICAAITAGGFMLLFAFLVIVTMLKQRAGG
ncbi:MAG: hypothetical protein KDA37_01495 [Planctomycetales bacterium]|nr:hypothetical protein [Planctomycetales bacterium]